MYGRLDLARRMEVWRSGGQARTASRRRRRATSTTRRSPGSYLGRIESDHHQATFCVRRPRTRAPGARGRTRVDGSGSASGTPPRSGCTTRRPRWREWRLPVAGRSRTRSSWTTATSCGSVTSAPTRSSASIPGLQGSPRCRCPALDANVRQIHGRPGRGLGRGVRRGQAHRLSDLLVRIEGGRRSASSSSSRLDLLSRPWEQADRDPAVIEAPSAGDLPIDQEGVERVRRLRVVHPPVLLGKDLRPPRMRAGSRPRSVERGHRRLGVGRCTGQVDSSLPCSSRKRRIRSRSRA